MSKRANRLPGTTSHCTTAPHLVASVTLNYGCCEANNDDNDVDVDVDEDDWKAVASYYNTSSPASESVRMPCHGSQDA
ncbi:hypothetical protein ACLKA6_013026 [Drosophila palustris]